MSFISYSFFFFFPTVTVLYFLLPHRWRWLLLLVASCIFYMAFVPAYILILFGLIIVDYTAGILLESVATEHRKYVLLTSILATCSVLFVFKYFNFFNANMASLAALLHWSYPIATLSLLLPLGLSFHTFQSLSYVIEVYRGKYKAERHLGIYALYVMFFPQLVAGPIERPQQLLPQFYEEHVFEYERVKSGLIRMAWGIFKKSVIADHLARIVDPVFADPSHFSGPVLIIASLCFTLELYMDFSAYCDIALGAAQVLGFNLMENFNRPFAAKNMADFWRRWHISLSSWFRDYFYYPLLLGGKKITRTRIYLVTLFTFLVTGFWHGANWTFGVFGALHGFYIVFGTATQNLREKLARVSGWSRFPLLQRILQPITIFVLMTLACVFFRSASVGEAWYIITHIASKGASLPVDLHTFGIPIIFSGLVFVCEYIGRNDGMFVVLGRQSAPVRWACYFVVAYFVIALSTTYQQFIYFQF
jgi:alginate O-acetyltransferase complex protein AlgI